MGLHLGLLTLLVRQVMEQRGLLAPVDWWIARNTGLSLGGMVAAVVAADAVHCWVLQPACWWVIEQIRREHASVNGLRRQLGTGWRTVWEAILPASATSGRPGVPVRWRRDPRGG